MTLSNIDESIKLTSIENNKKTIIILKTKTPHDYQHSITLKNNKKLVKINYY